MRFIIFAAALLIAPLPGACQQAAENAEQRAETLSVTIRTAAGARHAFTAEVARTAAAQERGLMYRTELAPDRGMLFLFLEPGPRSFWMKNMLISIDLLFIRPDGSIAKIAEEAVPGLLDPIVCTEPAIAVLEIPAGRAAALSLAEGDHVDWSGK